MKRMRCALNLFLLFLILLVPLSARAAVEILDKMNIMLDGKPVDVVLSLNGRWIYVLTEDAKLLVYTAEGKLSGSIALDSSFDGIRAGAGEESLLLMNRGEKRVEVVSLEFVRQIEIQGAPFKGPPDAPVEIVVFSEFQCPYCARLAPLLDEVMRTYDGQVEVVFKNYPLRTHRFSFMAAAAALAAGEQGKFWEFHDLLFKNINMLNPQQIQKISAELGLELKRFNNDMKNPAVLNRIKKDIEDGGKAGVKGTPTVYVNGRLVREGSLQGIKAVVEAELAKSKGTQQKAEREGAAR